MTLIAAESSSEARLMDEMVQRGSTAELLEIVAGHDAAQAYRARERLWPLLDDPAKHDLALDTAARLAALRELANRLAAEPRVVGAPIRTPEAAANLFHHLAALDHEQLHAVFMNTRNVVIAIECVAIGGVASVEVTPAQILRPALCHRASALILCHPHPSGDPTPSEQNIDLTNVIRCAARTVGIELLDHIVIGAAGRAHSILIGGSITAC